MNKPAKIAGTESVEDVLHKLDEQRATNLRYWNALGKTDPAHTKQFSRAGGFKGTAIKPIWITQRLTEQFGPCGEGWGFEKPEFQLVPALDEMMVYCTVTAWYAEQKGEQKFVYGVGGDKVITKFSSGLKTDDEAFKKAFTDALGNAFKFVGVGADVHMGLFEDSKYLAAVSAEFHPPPVKEGDGGNPTAKERPTDYSPSALRGAIKVLVRNIHGCASVRELDELLELQDAKDTMEQCERRFPAWWVTGEGCPAEFTPLKKLIEQTRAGLAEVERNDEEQEFARASLGEKANV